MKRALLVLFVAVCGEPPAAVAPAPRLATPRPAASATLAAQPPDAGVAEELVAILEAPPAVCVLRGGWKGQPLSLSLHSTGKPFGSVYHPSRAELTLAADGKTAFVELWTSVLRVRGFVPGEALALHAARPFLLAGYVAPGPHANLAWTGVKDGRVSVKMALPAHVKPKTPATGEQSCDDLALTEANFSARDAIVEKTLSDAMLQEGKTIPLALRAGGPAIADLLFAKDDGPLVDVVAREGASSRVVVNPHSLDPDRDLVLVGWVPTALLRRHDRGFGGSWATGGDPTVGMRPHRGRRVACAAETPLIAELDGEVRIVGAILPDVPINVLDGEARGDLVPVEPKVPTIEPAAGVRFLAKRALLDRCAPVP